MGNKQLTEQDRQQEIFHEIAKKYHSYIFLVITSALGRSWAREDAEELVQDTLYALWNHPYTLQSKAQRVLRLLCLACARLAGSEDFGNTIVDRFFIFDCAVSQIEISFQFAAACHPRIDIPVIHNLAFHKKL